MHHQAGVNFENFTEVKFRDILLTGTGHRTDVWIGTVPAKPGRMVGLNQWSSTFFVQSPPYRNFASKSPPTY